MSASPPNDIEAATATADPRAPDRSLSDFLSLIGHELRTPLNVILGYGELLESEISGPMTPGQRDHVARIRASAWHLLQIVEDVLCHSRMEAGSLELAWDDVDAGEIAEEVSGLLKNEARRKGIDLRVEGPEDVVKVRVDRSRLQQVLLNLLSNAVRCTEQGMVILSFETSGDTVFFHLRDTGPGIPEDRQAAIFEPFARLESNGDAAAGVGLGLSVSRRLAQLMGGDLTVESSVGEGSVFSVRLPAAP